MKKFQRAIIYGFVIAFAGTVLMLTLLGLDLLGPDAVASDREMIGGTVLFLMIYLFLLFGIYFVLRKSKEQNSDNITFKEAFLQGILTSFSTALGSVIFTYLFYEVLYPEYVNEMLAALQEKMQMNHVTEAKLEEKLEERAAYFRTSVQSTYSFVGNFITGLAFTLLLSFFLHNRKK